jgi:hypothetical protein
VIYIKANKLSIRNFYVDIFNLFYKLEFSHKKFSVLHKYGKLFDFHVNKVIFLQTLGVKEGSHINLLCYDSL